MPKQIIVIMQDNYPFGECEQRTTEKTKVLVRKIYQVSVQQRAKLLEKVNILRKLRNEHMIKIQSVLEEEESIHFLFQYIPIKLETWISNINDQFIENFRDQLIKFSSFLANNYIKIDFELKNIGMDQNYGAKYFLDINFTVDTTINREKLKSAYIREITSLFKPYILSNNPAASIVSDSERSAKNNEFKSNKQLAKKAENENKAYNASVSPPTNRQSGQIKNKEKALAQYYQDVNMSVDSENQKILQEFMDVLDNDQVEEVKKQPPKKAIAQKPQSNSFQRQPSSHNVPATFQASNTNTPPPQFHSQQNVGNFQSPQIPQNTSISQSTGRGKSNQKSPQQSWRQSIDLQNRVKSAIEKSLIVIKKFKAIKENI